METSRNSTRWSENDEAIYVKSPKKMTRNDSVFSVSHDDLGDVGSPRPTKDFVKRLKDDFDNKVRDIQLNCEREEEIRRKNQERRKKHLQELLRKRRQAADSSVISSDTKGADRRKIFEGQSYQSNVDYRTEIKEFKPVLGEEPAPIPLQTSKKVLYSKLENIELFEDLEDFATNLKSENVTFAVLMKSLLIPDLTELERVRILFHWISSQNLDAIEFPDHVAEDSPYGHLKAMREKRSNYSTLFQRLCKAAGIHCKVIRGFLKCAGYFPDHSFRKHPSQFLGSWNAVFIHGEWRLIDTSWGARRFEDNKIVYKYEEHYFLTDPDQLITSHFPFQSEWQLLHQPRTLKQFENAVQNWPKFYNLKLSHGSHYNGLYSTDRGGNIQIKLVVPSDDYEFGFNLYPRHKKQVGGIVKGDAKQMNAKVIFDVHLPHVDDYILKLYAKKKGETSSVQLSRYQLHYPK